METTEAAAVTAPPVDVLTYLQADALAAAVEVLAALDDFDSNAGDRLRAAAGLVRDQLNTVLIIAKVWDNSENAGRVLDRPRTSAASRQLRGY